jgi:hypothetical protein
MSTISYTRVVHPPPPSTKDTLTRLVSKSIASFAAASTWEEFVGKCQDPRGEFHPDVKHLSHRAAHMLNFLRTQGAIFGLKTGKWTRAQKLDALERGSHQSACQHSDFLCEEFVDMIQKGHWVLLPAHMVLYEENLRLSPLGVASQRDRCPRTICDYTFFSVSLDTTPLTPSESMPRPPGGFCNRYRLLTPAWSQYTYPRLTLPMASTEFGSTQMTSPSSESCSLEPQATSPSLVSLWSSPWGGCSPLPCLHQQQRQSQT